MIQRVKNAIFTNSDSVFHDAHTGQWLKGLSKKNQEASMYGRMASLAGRTKEADLADLSKTPLGKRQAEVMKQTERLRERGVTDTRRFESLDAENQMLAGLQRDLAGAKDQAGIKSVADKYAGLQRGADKDLWNDLRDSGGVAKDYFFGNEFKTNAIRTGAAAGAYMGVAAGARYMSGGGLTYNNQGERDIAGIPFL